MDRKGKQSNSKKIARHQERKKEIKPGGTMSNKRYALNFGDIRGDCTDKLCPEWIVVESFSFSIDRDVEMKLGALANREISGASFSPIHITKYVCAGSTGLIKAAGMSGSGTQAELKVMTTGNGETIEVMVITLENAMVTHYSINNDLDNQLESISISFSAFQIKHTTYDESNKTAQNLVVSADLAAGTMS